MPQSTGALTEAVLYILLSLYRPMHGYGIMQNVFRLSNGRVDLGAGTLYGAITTLLQKQWISPSPSEEGSRKKEYIISPEGKEVVMTELERLKELYDNGIAITKE